MQARDGGIRTKILERTPIVGLAYALDVKPRKSGTIFEGASPFGEGKVQFFPEENLFYCEASGLSGDPVDFYSAVTNTSQQDSLAWLAARAGLGVTHEKTLKRIQEARFETMEFFSEQLYKSEVALDYLKGRGFTMRTIENWELGYAPSDPFVLRDHLADKGFSASELREYGILRLPEDRPDTHYHHVALFRGRVMFPVFAADRSIQGFAGRALGDDKPKYLNSPHTRDTEKKTWLYGAHSALRSFDHHDEIYVAEGYIDVLTAQQAGISNVVCVAGTSFTDQHAAILSGQAGRVVLVFDADKPGLEAALHSAPKLVAKRTPLEILVLEKGQDLDDALRGTSKKEARTFLSSAQRTTPLGLLERMLQDEAAPEERAKLATLYVPIIQAERDPIARMLGLEELAKVSGFSRMELERQVLGRGSRVRNPSREVLLSSGAYMVEGLVGLACSRQYEAARAFASRFPPGSLPASSDVAFVWKLIHDKIQGPHPEKVFPELSGEQQSLLSTTKHQDTLQVIEEILSEQGIGVPPELVVACGQSVNLTDLKPLLEAVEHVKKRSKEHE